MKILDNRRYIAFLAPISIVVSSCGLTSSVGTSNKVVIQTTTTLPVIVLPTASNPPQQPSSYPSETSIAQASQIPAPTPTTAVMATPETVSAVAASSQSEPATTTSVASNQVTTTTTTTTTSQSSPPATTSVTSPSSLPLLGTESAYVGGVGFGSVEPSILSLGGDPTGTISGVTWSSWGDSIAQGSGMASYVAPGQATASAVKAQATIVAFNLGICNGEMVYRDVEWYFPTYGQSMSSALEIPTCPIS